MAVKMELLFILSALVFCVTAYAPRYPQFPVNDPYYNNPMWSEPAQTDVWPMQEIKDDYIKYTTPDPISTPKADVLPNVINEMDEWNKEYEVLKAERDKEIDKFCDEMREGEIDVFLWLAKMKIRLMEVINLHDSMHSITYRSALDKKFKRSTEFTSSEEKDLNEFLEKNRSLNEKLNTLLDFLESFEDSSSEKFTKRSAEYYLETFSEESDESQERQDRMWNELAEVFDSVELQTARWKSDLVQIKFLNKVQCVKTVKEMLTQSSLRPPPPPAYN